MTIEDQPTLPVLLRRIQLDWGMDSTQMASLAHVDVATYEGWVASKPEPEAVSSAIPQPTVPPGMDNAVPLVSIYRRLSAVVSSPEEQVQWLVKPHSAFDQNPPVDVMRSSLANLNWVAYFMAYAPATADALSLN